MPSYSGVLHIVGFDAFMWVWVLRVEEAMAQPYECIRTALSLVGTVREDG